MNQPTLETVQIETAPNPTAAVIWLHGLGADGNDFVPIVRELDLTGCPPIRFIFPHAPTMPITINNGMVMPAWYDIVSTDLVKREDEAGLRASEAAIAQLIMEQEARGIPAERIVLAGFSQGCAMTLQTGLRYPKKLAGLMCLSGYVPLAAMLENERHSANHQTPIFMAHGEADPVVQFHRAEQSRDLLLALNCRVEWHAYPMQHSVCPEEIDDISQWFQQLLMH